MKVSYLQFFICCQNEGSEMGKFWNVNKKIQQNSSWDWYLFIRKIFRFIKFGWILFQRSFNVKLYNLQECIYMPLFLTSKFNLLFDLYRSCICLIFSFSFIHLYLTLFSRKSLNHSHLIFFHIHVILFATQWLYWRIGLEVRQQDKIKVIANIVSMSKMKSIVQ